MDRTKDASLRVSLSARGFRLVLAASATACLAALFLLFDGHYRNDSSARDAMRQFQRAIGGLGLGSAATPAWNVMHYDPRLQPVDDSNLWPMPGSYPYSPSAISSAVAIGELPRKDLEIVRIKE